MLSDDNFATIVAAIEEGRNIYENIRKFIRYLLASNVGEILDMFIAMMLGMPLPLVPIQILWVNLVTDGLPAMALGVDQAEKDLMEQKPRSAKENIFARRLGWKIISRGVLIGFCTLAAFWLTLHESGKPRHLFRRRPLPSRPWSWRSSSMCSTAAARVRSSIAICSQNKYLVLAVLSSLVLMLGVMYIALAAAGLQNRPLGFREWAWCWSSQASRPS